MIWKVTLLLLPVGGCNNYNDIEVIIPSCNMPTYILHVEAGYIILLRMAFHTPTPSLSNAPQNMQCHAY